ncbi:hypothetical protein PtrSN002B_006842 [Pyrenophora tritici-repentis]|nr:hypothetical protein PtrV1_00564 [Pyrenophora tritici-repentis]KAF7453279.1 hypothetical protein A1F99_005370 [Pyrenophora tritici-repentis]KAF7576341.1 hypothetical protein PtrM4_005810 [Pyrenophora tritici-repentis]KAI1537222.1 hypothetical protein PtrSN001C_006203 [Pyrenophora tritici-repentis]KAI1547040.1 hypothetical protein PtrSN002B_006842 [Pyrenophora tritici-repentis]
MQEVLDLSIFNLEMAERLGNEQGRRLRKRHRRRGPVWQRQWYEQAMSGPGQPSLRILLATEQEYTHESFWDIEKKMPHKWDSSSSGKTKLQRARESSA